MGSPEPRAAGPWAPRRLERGCGRDGGRGRLPRGARAGRRAGRRGRSRRLLGLGGGVETATANRRKWRQPRGRGRAGAAGRRKPGLASASRAGSGRRGTHGAGPGGSLSASASSPSPSSAAAAASGCSLGPRGAAWALGPSVVFRPLLLPATGSCGGGGGCAGGRRPRGSRGGRRTAAALAHSFGLRLCGGAGCCLRVLPAPGASDGPQAAPLPETPVPGPSPALTCELRSRGGHDVGRRRNTPPHAPRLWPRAPPGGRADSGRGRVGILAEPKREGAQTKAEAEDQGSSPFTCHLNLGAQPHLFCATTSSCRNSTSTFSDHFPNS